MHTEKKRLKFFIPNLHREIQKHTLTFLFILFVNMEVIRYIEAKTCIMFVLQLNLFSSASLLFHSSCVKPRLVLPVGLFTLQKSVLTLLVLIQAK